MIKAIVLHRQIKADLAMVAQRDPEQLCLSFAELTDDTIVYEYAVLAASLANEILTIARLYRDRADAENPFDELKNHWGWGGFTTQDIKRCRFMARITALVYNWWSLFVRLADPRQHPEAITSRLLLHAPARALIIILPTLVQSRRRRFLAEHGLAHANPHGPAGFGRICDQGPPRASSAIAARPASPLAIRMPKRPEWTAPAARSRPSSKHYAKLRSS